MNKSNRYKKRGWHGESHRHYLAAKGIKTAFDPIKYRYFNRAGIRDDLKGRNMSSALAAMTAAGFSTDDIINAPDIATPYEIKAQEQAIERGEQPLPLGHVYREVLAKKSEKRSLPTRDEVFGTTARSEFDFGRMPRAELPLEAPPPAPRFSDITAPGMQMTGAQAQQQLSAQSEVEFEGVTTPSAGQMMTQGVPERSPLEAQL